MPRGQSLTNLKTAEITQASYAFCSDTRISARIWGNVRCCVSFQCKQHCIIRINPARLLYHPSTCGPSNESPTSEWEEKAASFLEHFYRLFFGVPPKLECRVSLSMVHIHPGAEWQEAGHSCPVKQLLKAFLLLTVATLEEESEGQRQTSLAVKSTARAHVRVSECI